MGYSPGDNFYRSFTTQTLAGSLRNADSLPNAHLRRNGVDDAELDAACTVNNLGTGDYNVTGVIPARYNIGDTVEIVILATVLTVLGEATRSLGKLDSTQVISVPVVPVVTTSLAASSVGGTEKPLTIFQSTTGTFSWKIADGSGNQVDLSGHTIDLYIHNVNTDVVVATVSGANVILSRSDPSGHPTIYDTVSITVMPTHVINAGKFEYKVRDLTANLIYGSGSFIVKWAP